METSERHAAAARLRQALVEQANLGGGWAYYSGKASRVEPTCWALLALSGDAQPGDDAAHAALLRARQRADGLLVDYPQAPVNFTSNGTAACLGASVLTDTGFTDRIVSGMIAVKGVSVALDDPRQNNRLQAWPWMADTFSWIEPTAWGVLALKKTGAVDRLSGARARLGEAEALIRNRVCDEGGWNYGNASALGQDLRAHVPTSAIALLALQDRRDDPVVARSLDYLVNAQLREASSLALGLTSLALRVYGRPSDAVDARLAGLADHSVRLGNLHAMAVALYALTADRHNAEALRVAA